MKIKKSDALLIVDPQVDFVSGTLPVPGAIELREPLLRLTKQFAESKARDHVFISRDWHPFDHCSFVENGGKWPTHCISNSDGAGIAFPIAGSYFNIFKGEDSKDEAYSAFEGHRPGFLKCYKIKRLFVCGLAIEYCVRSTVLDALNEGYNTYVIPEATRGINATAIVQAWHDMWAAGAHVVSVAEIHG